MENLIGRIANALAYGCTGTEVAVRFASEGSPEVIWLAYKAAWILVNDTTPVISEEDALCIERAQEEHDNHFACSREFF